MWAISHQPQPVSTSTLEGFPASSWEAFGGQLWKRGAMVPKLEPLLFSHALKGAFGRYLDAVVVTLPPGAVKG